MNLDDYERLGRSAYAELARAIASILEAAISAEPEQQLQQVKARAKEPVSLKRKLGNGGILETETLAAEIKDLAGCRGSLSRLRSHEDGFMPSSSRISALCAPLFGGGP